MQSTVVWEMRAVMTPWWQRSLSWRHDGGVSPTEMNSPMEPLHARAQALLTVGTPLAAPLQDLVDDGLVEQDGELYFRRLLHRLRTVQLDSPTDRENWVNAIHLDDVVDQGPDWGARCVAQGRLLGEAVVAALPPVAPVIEYWISVDLGEEDDLIPSSTFRFLTSRPDDQWAGSVDGFAQPVLRVLCRPWHAAPGADSGTARA